MPETNERTQVDIVVHENGQTRVVASAIFENGAVRLEGEESMLEELRLGVVDPVTKQTLTPESGEAFLGVLPVVYRTPYLFAAFVTQS